MNDALERVKLHSSWKNALRQEFTSNYMVQLREFLLAEIAQGKRLHPPMSKIFLALDLCPLDQVRVVIIGQDPYHGPNQAHGLCFSVNQGVPVPPSLVNILSEIHRDIGADGQSTDVQPHQGCLVPWATQGVLLLNAVLTVVEGNAGSHQGRGWERFTDRVVNVVNEQCENVVFLLWGQQAQRKAEFVNRSMHCVLTAPHPSPLSANRGFFGCGHFSAANEYLASHGYDAIDWLAIE